MRWNQTRVLFFLTILCATSWQACSGSEVPDSEVIKCQADEDCGTSESCINTLCVSSDSGDLTEQEDLTGQEDQREQPEDQREQPEDQREQPEDQREQPGDQREQPTDQGTDVPTNNHDMQNPDIPDEEAPRRLGDSCETGADCSSGYCITANDGRLICTDYCEEDACPDDYICIPVADPRDISLCFPTTNFLCEACTSDGDCGNLNDLCLETTDGTFCARDCSLQACPDGYDCEEFDHNGNFVAQCRPQSNYCSDCYDTDDDGYGIGDGCMDLDCNLDDASIHPGAEEICDGIDNNCNDEIDEGFDTQTDPLNCGTCGNECETSNDEPTCVEGVCVADTCPDNYYDYDPDIEGCEYACEITNDGVEICDAVDNNCDGQIDEDFNLLEDVNNCNACNYSCASDWPDGQYAITSCNAGACQIMECITGFGQCEGDTSCQTFLHGLDIDNCGACDYNCSDDWLITGKDVTEVACGAGSCTITGCTGAFLDCDNEDTNGCETDASVSIDHCLACGNECRLPNAVMECASNGCAFVECEDGYYDHDSGVDGCEYFCPDGDPSFTDTPDDDFFDTNCDLIDGDASRAIFVSNGDNGDGLSRQSPVNSLQAAINIAKNNPDRDQILVAVGTYTAGQIIIENIPGDLGIYGGYASNFLSRTNARPTVISTQNTALLLRSLSSTVIVEGINFRVNDRVSTRFDNSIPAHTIRVYNIGDRFTLHHVDIEAGTGSDGADGEAPQDANGRPPGNNGDGIGGGAAHEDNGGGGAGGNGGFSALGRNGKDGESGNEGAAHGNGGRGYGCFVDDLNPENRDGTNGARGINGAQGVNGNGGNNLGSLNGALWNPGNGDDSGRGEQGTGGGGGGGGGGEECGRVCDFFGGNCEPRSTGNGSGGGAGGDGGYGGINSQGGYGGGASIGVILHNSTITMNDVHITTADGGHGGNGRRRNNGGRGANGGYGGPRRTNNNGNPNGGSGGNGGFGGEGGPSGCGGGGGGGPSIGIWGNSSAIVRATNVTYSIGSGGEPGTSVCGGPDGHGANGAQSDSLNVTFE